MVRVICAGDLPPLKGGETFPKTLRFIVQKRALKCETEMLCERRVKEVNLKSYISLKIDDILATTDSDEQVILFHTCFSCMERRVFSNSASVFQSRNKGGSLSRAAIGEGGSIATKNSMGSNNSNNVFFTDSDSLTQTSFTAKGLSNYTLSNNFC